MPCMGPDLEAARASGRIVGRKYLRRIINEYKLFDITLPKYGKMMKLPNAEERWTKAKADFIEAVAALFEEDASNGF